MVHRFRVSNCEHRSSRDGEKLNIEVEFCRQEGPIDALMTRDEKQLLTFFGKCTESKVI